MSNITVYPDIDLIKEIFSLSNINNAMLKRIMAIISQIIKYEKFEDTVSLTENLKLIRSVKENEQIIIDVLSGLEQRTEQALSNINK